MRKIKFFGLSSHFSSEKGEQKLARLTWSKPDPNPIWKVLVQQFLRESRIKNLAEYQDSTSYAKLCATSCTVSPLPLFLNHSTSEMLLTVTPTEILGWRQCAILCVCCMKCDILCHIFWKLISKVSVFTFFNSHFVCPSTQTSPVNETKMAFKTWICECRFHNVTRNMLLAKTSQSQSSALITLG